jgi:hypothetical protein
MVKALRVKIPLLGIAVYEVCPPFTLTGNPVVASITVTVTGGELLINTFPLESFTTIEGSGSILLPATMPDVLKGVKNDRLEAVPARGCTIVAVEVGGGNALSDGSVDDTVYATVPVPLGTTPLNVAIPFTMVTTVEPLRVDDVEVEVEVVEATARVTVEDAVVTIFPPASTTATVIGDGIVLVVVVYGVGCEMNTICEAGPGAILIAELWAKFLKVTSNGEDEVEPAAGTDTPATK